MKTLFLRPFFKFKTRFCFAVLIALFYTTSCFSINQDEATQKFVKIVPNKNPFYLPFYPKQLKFKIPKKAPLYSQTISFLKDPVLKKSIEKKYRKEISEVNKIFFKNTIKTAIERELEFTDSFALYHGQQLEFLLFQDIFEILYEIFFEKSLENFFILRTPSKEFKKFKNIHEILNPYIKNETAYKERLDDKGDFSKFMLCVNASIFGNYFRKKSCTIYFFLTSSNKSNTNVLDRVKEIFALFKIQDLYNKHLEKIKKLKKLLSSDDSTGKTGLLMQLFVPNTEINEIAYRANPGGSIYHHDLKTHPASIDLINCKYNTPIFKKESPKKKDKTQFRLLMNEKMFPGSNIKMFRYYNETKKTEKYKELLTTLIQDLRKDIEQKYKFKKPKISF